MKTETKTTRQFEYLLYRKGSNSANQPMTWDWVPIAIVRAPSRGKAEETTWGDGEPSVYGCPTVAAEVVASCGNLDVWANQSLMAVPQSRARASDWNHVLEVDAMENSFA
jgi:hypothetical protein